MSYMTTTSETGGIVSPMRRPDGSGTFQYLPSGKVRNRLGKTWGSACRTKKEALESAKAKRLECGPMLKDGSVLLAKIAVDTALGLRDVSPRTQEGYEGLARNLSNHPIGKVPVGKVVPRDVQDWLDSLTVSNTSRARYLEGFKALFQRWVVLGIVPRNPASGIRKPKRDPVYKRILAFAEFEEIVATVTPELELPVRLCLHGVCRGEVCALRRDDFDGEAVMIVRSASEPHGVLLNGPPKVPRRVRWVPLDDRTRALIEPLDGWLVRNSRGGQMRPSNLYNKYVKAIKGTRFEGVGLHHLRSSFGTELQRRGVDVRTVAEIMGHHPAVLAEKYMRSDKEVKKEALKRLYG